MSRLPKVSIVIPTLNSERTLERCLASIENQLYNGEVEVIISDGESNDNTLAIAKSFNVRILKNKLKTGEAGKAVGSKAAKGEIIAFVDSDNVLPDSDWLAKMIYPFVKDSEVVATEPSMFSYQKSDPWLTRYFALIGMGDPLNLFIGNYDRYSFVSDKWTGMNLKTRETKDRIEIVLKDKIPTIGANGFLIRKAELFKYSFGDYLFDIDVLKFLSSLSEVKVVKVKIGITHLFSGDVKTFVRKQRRRIRDFLHFKKIGLRAEQTDRLTLIAGVVKFTLATVTFLPLVVQSIIGFSRKPDIAWVFHPIACILTLYIYSSEMIKSLSGTSEYSRKAWSQ